MNPVRNITTPRLSGEAKALELTLRSRGGRRAQSSTRRRAGARTNGDLHAGELAAAIGALVELGLVARANGACLGATVASRVSLHLIGWAPYVRSNHGTVTLVARTSPVRGRARRYREAALAAAHARREHDSGCYAFGVPLATLRELVHRWDGSGAAGLLLDAVTAAAEAELGEQSAGRGWRREGAAEILSLALCTRITPALPAAAGVAWQPPAPGSERERTAARRSRTEGQRRKRVPGFEKLQRPALRTAQVSERSNLRVG